MFAHDIVYSIIIMSQYFAILSLYTVLNTDNNYLFAGSLYNLVTLNLNHNSLHSLPPGIHYLTHLQLLSLSHNHLTNLPPELGSLSQLTELHLNSNKLATVPHEIGLLTRLKKLMLQKNDLSDLPLVRSRTNCGYNRKIMLLHDM